MKSVRMTKKWIHQNVSLQKDAIPGSVHFLKFSEALGALIANNDWQIEEYAAQYENRVMKRLEKLGYIKYNGMAQLTADGYRYLK